MSAYDPQKHHRRSMRLKGYKYNLPGAYFITLVTHQRAQIFGQIVDGEMQLSGLGTIAREEWLRSMGLRREIRLYEDEFVVMPNHIHGIVWIEGGRRPPQPVAGQDPVGADGVRPFEARPSEEAGGRRPPQPEFKRLPRSLSSFVAGFKSAVTSRARRAYAITEVWQRNYYDHIIRNEREFQRIWNYIDANPQRWEEDQIHPSAPPDRFNQD